MIDLNHFCFNILPIDIIIISFGVSFLGGYIVNLLMWANPKNFLRDSDKSLSFPKFTTASLFIIVIILLLANSKSYTYEAVLSIIFGFFISLIFALLSIKDIETIKVTGSDSIAVDIRFFDLSRGFYLKRIIIGLFIAFIILLITSNYFICN